MQEGVSTPVVGCIIPHGIQPRKVFFHVSSKGDGGRRPDIVFIEDDADAAG